MNATQAIAVECGDPSAGAIVVIDVGVSRTYIAREWCDRLAVVVDRHSCVRGRTVRAPIA